MLRRVARVRGEEWRVDDVLVLEGVFLALVRQGVRLSLRDYQDALRALRCGYGLHQRERLRWLCQTLWARSEEESRVIDRVFQAIALPTLAEVRVYEPQPLESGGGSAAVSAPEPRTMPDGAPRAGTPATFVAPDQPGWSLPRARAVARGGPFIMTPQPIIARRSLIVAWRRFRMALRSGPLVEIDLAATIAQRCRAGVLVEPVLRAARRNQARVVVLVDVSESMVPWAVFCAQLVGSLRESRLGAYQVYYFHNAPGEQVYRQPTLLEPVALDALLVEAVTCPLLIVSDGGAARHTWSRERLAATRHFVVRVGGVWRPIVWLNPLPVARWAGTTAARIGRLPSVTMVDVQEERLIDAIDVLRGQRSG